MFKSISAEPENILFSILLVVSESLSNKEFQFFTSVSLLTSLSEHSIKLELLNIFTEFGYLDKSFIELLVDLTLNTSM